MRNIFFALLCIFSLNILAQNNKFTITVPSDYSDGLILYISPINTDNSSDSYKLEFENGLYVSEVPSSESGFYQIVGIKNQTQLYLYVYQPEKNSEINIALSLEKKILCANNTLSNTLLSGFNILNSESTRFLWSEKNIESDDIFSVYLKYKAYADSVMSLPDCPQPVKEFIKVDSYNTVYNSIDLIKRTFMRSGKELNFELEDIMPSSSEMLDNEMSAYLVTSKHAISKEISPYLSLREQIDVLCSNYKNDKVRSVVINYLVQRFVSNFDYNGDFESGRELLVEIVRQYELDADIITNFDLRRAKQIGSPFPQNVVLRDVNGNTVDISQFKGKYIYIDMWASWCVPCLKEIPHLQKLEAELKDKDIVFLSISIDTDEKAWKKAILTRNLHGNQFIDCENRLAKALGVVGIPFFILYDKEGRLLEYGAPRPSQRQEIIKLIETLKL